jgi:hypothetical protein
MELHLWGEALTEVFGTAIGTFSPFLLGALWVWARGEK